MRGVGTGSATRRLPLPNNELRTLVKQAARHQSAADDLKGKVAAHDRRLSALSHREHDIARAIKTLKLRLASATRTLDEHDRPFRRRHHSFEITQAKHQVAELPASIENLEQELTELPEVAEAERAAKRRTVQKGTTAPRRAKADRVQAALGDDACVRGAQAAADPDQRLLDHLGSVPQDPTARGQWIEAAGRVAQHHALWGVAAGSLAGPMPPLGNDDYAVTFYAADRAIADLDRNIGVDRRSLGRPGPGLSL